MDDLMQLASEIELAIFDVDGVLTDGKLILGPNGEEYKAFHARDGQGLVMLRECVEVAIITGRSSSVVSDRMEQLGIKHVFQGQKNKCAALEQLLAELNLPPEATCYVGDDLPDLAAMTAVGFPIAVADANEHVRAHARWCTTLPGGHGAVREVCDLILGAKGQLDAMLDLALGGQVTIDRQS